MDQDVGMQSIK